MGNITLPTAPTPKRKDIEKQSGKPVVSGENFKQLAGNAKRRLK